MVFWRGQRQLPGKRSLRPAAGRAEKDSRFKEVKGMVPKRRRLARSAFLSKTTKKRHSDYFSLVIPAEASGYAIVISKKILKKAVDRHLLKRRTAAALRRQSATILPRAGIIFPKASALTAPFGDIVSDLATLLSEPPPMT